MSNETKKSKHSKTMSPAEQVLKKSIDKHDEPTSLDTIRDLLFGDQVRQVEQQQGTLQTELQQSINQLQQDANTQFQQLSYELERLHSLLNDESKKRMVETDRLDKQARELHDNISIKLERAARDLQANKINRKDMAGLLRNVAEQLLDEHKNH